VLIFRNNIVIISVVNGMIVSVTAERLWFVFRNAHLLLLDNFSKKVLSIMFIDENGR